MFDFFVIAVVAVMVATGLWFSGLREEFAKLDDIDWLDSGGFKDSSENDKQK